MDIQCRKVLLCMNLQEELSSIIHVYEVFLPHLGNLFRLCLLFRRH